MKKYFLLIAIWSALGMLVSTAGADPYWYAYEGNDFPENEGWERYSSDPPAERWLEDGALFIDSRGIVGSTENYTVYFDSGVDPGPDETFVMSWGLTVEETTHSDPGVYVQSDDLWTVMFLFDEEYLMSFYEPSVYVEIEPAVYHEYEMRSSDMRTYELYIDGDLAVEGVFFEGLFPPCVGFGDTTSSTSLAAWDYFRFGVVPEPATWLMIAALLPLLRRRNR